MNRWNEQVVKYLQESPTIFDKLILYQLHCLSMFPLAMAQCIHNTILSIEESSCLCILYPYHQDNHSRFASFNDANRNKHVVLPTLSYYDGDFDEKLFPRSVHRINGELYSDYLFIENKHHFHVLFML